MAANTPPRRLHHLKIQTVEHLCLLMGTKEHELISICRGIETRPDQYYRFKTIRRQNGKTRQLAIPQGLLCRILGRLNEHLQRLEFPNNMHGGLKGRTTRTYAAPHVRRRSVLKSDMKDFFPNIGPSKVYQAFIRLGCSPDVARYITRLTTVNGQLPQGSPTSTVIANLVSTPLALRLKGLADSIGGYSGTFVDDVAISGPTWVERITSTVTRIIRQEGFTPHRDKTMTVKSDDEQVIAGIRVNNHIDIPRAKLLEIGALIEEVRENTAKGASPTPAVLQSLRGRIRYVGSLNRGAAHFLMRKLERAVNPHT